MLGGKSKTSTSEGDIDVCNCRKPRARCALCLSRLNTAASLALFKTNGRIHTHSKFNIAYPVSEDVKSFRNHDKETSSNKNASSNKNHVCRPNHSPRFPFSSFTAFCATCRHSGHALHYLEWFKDNVNCPVAGCTCTCSILL
jgi:hypothetical protein